MEMEEYMKSELSGIFKVKMVDKNIVLGSTGNQFKHIRVENMTTVGHTGADTAFQRG